MNLRVFKVDGALLSIHWMKLVVKVSALWGLKAQRYLLITTTENSSSKTVSSLDVSSQDYTIVLEILQQF